MAATQRKKIEQAIDVLRGLQARADDEEREALDGVTALLSELDGELARLVDQVRWLEGTPYRKKSESAPPGQLAFDLIKLLTARLEETDDDSDAERPEAEAPVEARPAASRPRKKRKRRGAELPVQVVECRSEPTCSSCGEAEVEIGFDTQKRFMYEPAKVYVLEERRFKYACRRCAEGVTTVEPTLPPKPIPGSMASASLLAFIVVAKVLDGLPIERVAKQLRRHGVDLATSTLNDWFGRVADMLTLLHRRLGDRLRDSMLVSLDDTPLAAQSRGHPKNMVKGRQWLYLGDVDQVVYAEFTPDWKGIHPRRVLADFGGAVQNDGYAGINPLFGDPSGPRRVGCNDHARRKFVQALERGDRRAEPVVDLFRALYRVERVAAERGLDAAGRAALRNAQSVPIWNQLDERITKLADNAGRKSPLGKAIIYWQRQQVALRAFLDDGRLPISNAHVERLIRIVALFRKNSLFVGSVEAGQRFAVLLSLLLECELAGANPYDYLVDVIGAIANDWPAARVDELLPRPWLAARKAEEQAAGQAATAAGHR